MYERLLMDLYQLKTFYILCLNKSYTVAAKKLFVTQSAVSHAIKKLEASIAKKLIDKNKKEFFLTPEGKILFDHCKKIFFHIAKVQEDLKTLHSTTMEITIGSTIEFGTTVLIKQLEEFNREFKFGKIHMELHNEIMPYLLKDDVDLIIDCKLHLHEDLHSIPLFREEYVVICTPKYRHEKKIQVPLDLERCNLISLDIKANWWHRFYSALSDQKRPKLKNIIQINHIRGIINGTLASTGVGLVPKYTVFNELRRKKLIQLFPEIKLFLLAFFNVFS